MQEMRRQVTKHGRSLRGFDELKAIFVHIPKCAGVSVSNAMFGTPVGHTTMKGYQIAFGRRDFESYLKFSFVRNPWDRVCSAYMFLRAGGFDGADKRWATENLGSYDDFESFVMQWLTPRRIKGKRHFRMQADYVRAFDGTIPLDFVGRFERLDTDFAALCTALGHEASLPHRNKTPGKVGRYVDQYSDEMIERVRQVYAEDIEAFGYEFGE